MKSKYTNTYSPKFIPAIGGGSQSIGRPIVVGVSFGIKPGTIGGGSANICPPGGEDIKQPGNDI